jgi:hypothetical protein
VKTYPLLGFWFVHRIAGHVLAIRTATEGRQGTPLLEHCRIVATVFDAEASMVPWVVSVDWESLLVAETEFVELLSEP